ncbi:hypothetical protein M2366_002301 [Aeromonas sp. BIGb0405]|uniref:hypothetical protein n=1 Tax=Aeromonas sp. BIGb0405 TaxID=2940592 RepID=UPI002168125B|nr:hypothetical protein [Aeromonas sp. BIGb0405]MCS3456215.1 hypothetical protein [Aeromonas sp. BIGb0405]
MLSVLAIWTALLCLLLTVISLFKPALFGLKRRLNAFFIGLYAFLGFALLSSVPDGKIELGGGLVLLAVLSAAHGILLFFSHAFAVLRMSKEERAQRAASARPSKATAGVLILFVAAVVGAWLFRPTWYDAPMQPTESAMVQGEPQSAKAQRALSLADQCRLELDIYQKMKQTTDGVMEHFGGLLDGQQIDYNQIAEYRVKSVTPVISAARDSMSDVRTSNLTDDVVLRLAVDLVQRSDAFVGQLYTFARNGDVSSLQSARDQLAQVIASHKQALTVCDDSQKN